MKSTFIQGTNTHKHLYNNYYINNITIDYQSLLIAVQKKCIVHKTFDDVNTTKYN